MPRVFVADKSDPNIAGILRYRNVARRVGGKRVRFPQRRSRKGKKSTLTDSQRAKAKSDRDAKKKAIKAALKEARQQMWELAVTMADNFGSHDAEYYYRAIMQQPRLNKKRREISQWNAFVSQELRKHNEGTSIYRSLQHAANLTRHALDVTTGDRDRASSEVIKELSDRWQAMSKAERKAATAETLKELEERRKQRATGMHNVDAAAFRDAFNTILAIKEEVSELPIMLSHTNTYPRSSRISTPVPALRRFSWPPALTSMDS